MEIVTSFLSDFNTVADWVMTTLRGFFRTLYGSPGNTLYLRQILFIVAALPGIIGFCVEIIFSFVLSFRFRRLTIFIPWRYSAYDIVRHGSAHNLSYARNRMSIIKRGKSDLSINRVNQMPLLRFRKFDPERDPVGHTHLNDAKKGIMNKRLPEEHLYNWSNLTLRYTALSYHGHNLRAKLREFRQKNK